MYLLGFGTFFVNAYTFRPETDIPGLYISGQDILTCGFVGGLFSGVLTARVRLVSSAQRNLRTVETGANGGLLGPVFWIHDILV
jgi:hypothetical protein